MAPDYTRIQDMLEDGNMLREGHFSFRSGVHATALIDRDLLLADPGTASRFGYTIAKGALPDGGDRPLIYFDAGPEDPAGWVNEPTYGWYLRRGARMPGRQFRDLSRWSPPPGAQPAWSPAALGSATRPAATRPTN